MENFFKCLKKTENLFLIICLFFGILFTIITPPFMVSDENSHMAKMYNFTEGSINFQKLTVSGGGADLCCFVFAGKFEIYNNTIRGDAI